MKFRVFTTLRQRVALLLVSVIIPAIVLVVMNAVSTRSRDRAEVQQEAYRLARLASATHERLPESAGQLFSALSQIPAVVMPQSESCAMALAAVVTPGSQFQNVGVLSREGMILCSARPMTTPTVGDRPWLEEAVKIAGLVVGRYEAGLGPHPSVILARRVMPAGGDRVLFAAVDLMWLSELARTVPLPPQSSVNVVDDHGTILARYPAHAEWVGKDVRNVPLIATALAQGDGVIEAAGIDGVARLYGFHRVEMPGGSGFITTVGIPLDVAYEPANTRLRASLAILAVVAVVTLGVARMASDRLFTRKIDALLRAARRLSAGDLSARTEEPWSDDELGELARTFDSMAWAVGQRTEDLRQMMESLRALAARLESVREEERTRISREIHDELGQTLTGIRMDLDRLEERVAASQMSEAEKKTVDGKLISVRGLVDSALDTARRISRQLRPSVLDVLGLKAGIEWQLEEFRARTRIDTELLAPDDLAGIGEDISVTLFRILQEALTNVMRHANATMVTVRIEREDDSLVMEVMDNGRGFEQADRPYPASLGLLGMRERAAVLGGLTTVTSRPGHGTTVHVTLSVRPPSAPTGKSS